MRRYLPWMSFLLIWVGFWRYANNLKIPEVSAKTVGKTEGKNSPATRPAIKKVTKKVGPDKELIKRNIKTAEIEWKKLYNGLVDALDKALENNKSSVAKAWKEDINKDGKLEGIVARVCFDGEFAPMAIEIYAASDAVFKQDYEWYTAVLLADVTSEYPGKEVIVSKANQSEIEDEEEVVDVSGLSPAQIKELEKKSVPEEKVHHSITLYGWDPDAGKYQKIASYKTENRYPLDKKFFAKKLTSSQFGELDEFASALIRKISITKKCSQSGERKITKTHPNR